MLDGANRILPENGLLGFNNKHYERFCLEQTAPNSHARRMQRALSRDGRLQRRAKLTLINRLQARKNSFKIS